MSHRALILVVDDIAANRETLRELLDSSEYRLVEAPDGPTALRLAAETPPDLMLLDVMMPGMGGYEVCRRFRADPRLADVPIIMVTALDDMGALLAGLEAGADDFLTKPLHTASLRARVRTITRLNRYRRLVETREALQMETMEHQRAQESLRLLGAAVEQCTDSILITDADLSLPGPNILFVNSAFTRMTGYTAAEVLGKTPRILQGPASDPVVMNHLRDRLGRVELFEGETIGYRKDGQAFNLEWHLSPIRDARGEITHFATIQRDITVRKQAEEDFRNLHTQLEARVVERTAQLETARSVAERANLAKSDFLSSMSHELRSPLNAILGFAQLMESANPPATVSQKARIAHILQAGWYLLKLINEILDLSAIESGKASLSPEPVSLTELLPVCQAMMESQAQQRRIRMTFPGLDDPMFVMADRTRLQQIIVNLLSNAIKYNKEQGTVVVDCIASAPGRVRLSIRDTGAGLPPEKLAQLFQPFNRLGQEASGVAGTGIGLVVTKRLVEQMHGALGVESTVGNGSVFWCELDAAAAPQLAIQSGAHAARVPPPAPPGAPTRTLLYVEDNPANMELVQQVIAEYSNLRLATAENAIFGIEIARATQPQVILMDINLPGLSGFKALKILREDPATAHIPVVALSANAMPRDIKMGLEAGFFRYLTKPILVKDFMNTMNTALAFAARTDTPRQSKETP